MALSGMGELSEIPYLMGITVWASLVGVVLFGSVVGAMLPFLLRRAGI